MGVIRLTGQLICPDECQTALVAAHFPEHIRLTLAEGGCLSFDMRQSVNPLVWDVAEVFSSRAAFKEHQAWAAASALGQATKGIERQYVITGD